MPMPPYLVIAAQLLCPLNRLPNPARLHDDLVRHLALEDLRLSQPGSGLCTHEGVLRAIERWRGTHPGTHSYDLVEVE